MSASELKEMEERFRTIVKDNGILDEVSEVIMKDAGMKGEGFASQTHLVTVKFQDSSLKPLSLFVKTETSNPTHTQFLEDTRFFDKESSFFTKYIPEVTKFCREKGEEQLLEIYPKCYFGDKKMVVLENLVEKGFQTLDKAAQQDFEAACMSLKTLAKHHAISHAFIKEVGGPTEFFNRFPSLNFEPFANDSIKNMMDAPMNHICRKIFEKSPCEGGEEAVEYMEGIMENLWDLMMECLKVSPEDPIVLLNHGDFWNNNMMFQKDNDTLKGPIAIDMQAVRYDSPATDLGYFLFSSVKPQVRREKLQQLLEVYLEAFNSITERLGHPANLSYQKLFPSFRRKFRFGYWFWGCVFSAKVNFNVLSSFDVSNVDMQEAGAVYIRLFEEWLDANPDICEEEGKAIVQSIKEYKALSLD